MAKHDLTSEELTLFIGMINEEFDELHYASDVPTDEHVFEYGGNGPDVLADLWPLESFIVDCEMYGFEMALKNLDHFVVNVDEK